MNVFTRGVASALIAVSATVLTGCSGAESSTLEGTASATPVVVESDRPTAAPTPTPAPTPELGTRANPFPLNTAGQYDATSMWTVTFTGTNGDAWADVQRQNPYNTPPAAGHSDVLGSMTVAAGEGAPAQGAEPSASLEVTYVGSDGNSYDTINYPCGGDMAGAALQDAGAMFAGATRTVTVCTQVPTSAVAGGTWSVASYLDATKVAFFAGA